VASYILENCSGKLIPNSNRTFKLNWATFSAGKMQALLGTNINQQEYTIYVCDLDLNVSEEMLKEFFEKLYPSVISSKLVVDPISKASKGYGFVKFNDYNESQKAIIEMNGKYIYSKPIKTNQAVWKKYNPECNKNSNNFSQKNYQNNYYKQQNNSNNMNYINQQAYYNQFNNTPNMSYVNASPSITYTSNNNTSMNQTQPVTQNINIYLQSLYQQHYLNNVYFNQFLSSGNGNVTQQLSNLSLDTTNEINNNSENDSPETCLKNENFLPKTNNLESSISNTEGK
jgi:RNA recognition motif-containing protein